MNDFIILKNVIFYLDYNFMLDLEKELPDEIMGGMPDLNPSSMSTGHELPNGLVQPMTAPMENVSQFSQLIKARAGGMVAKSYSAASPQQVPGLHVSPSPSPSVGMTCGGLQKSPVGASNTLTSPPPNIMISRSATPSSTPYSINSVHVRETMAGLSNCVSTNEYSLSGMPSVNGKPVRVNSPATAASGANQVQLPNQMMNGPVVSSSPLGMGLVRSTQTSTAVSLGHNNVMGSLSIAQGQSHGSSQISGQMEMPSQTFMNTSQAAGQPRMMVVSSCFPITFYANL